MIFLILCISAYANKLIEYKLWKNYGQIIPDSSLNNKHAVNGLNSSSDSFDCLYSDRGLYFADGTSALRLPPNNQVQTLDRISTPYTVIMWVNNLKSEGRYFSRWMNQQYLTIKSADPNTIGIVYRHAISELYVLSSQTANYSGNQ